MCDGDPYPTLYNHAPYNPGGMVSYKWYQGVGQVISTSGSFTPSGPGSFCLEITDMNTGCKTTDCITVSKSPYLTMNKNFNVYPPYFYAGGNTYKVRVTFNEVLSGMGEAWYIYEVDGTPAHNVIATVQSNPSGWWPEYNDGDGEIDFSTTNPSVVFQTNKYYKIKRVVWSNDGCLLPTEAYHIVYQEHSGSTGGGGATGGGASGGGMGAGKQEIQLKDVVLSPVTSLQLFPNPTNGSVNVAVDGEVNTAVL